MTRKRAQGNFWGDGNVLNLDWGGGYICQNSVKYMLIELRIVLFRKLTLSQTPTIFGAEISQLAVSGSDSGRQVVVPAAVAMLQFPHTHLGRPQHMARVLARHSTGMLWMPVFSLGSLGGRGRRSPFFALALLQMSSSLHFLFSRLIPRFAIHASLNVIFKHFLLVVSLPWIRSSCPEPIQTILWKLRQRSSTSPSEVISAGGRQAVNHHLNDSTGYFFLF